MNIVTSSLVLILGASLVLSCHSPQRMEKSDVTLPIIPQPNEVRVYEGTFILDTKTAISAESDIQNKVTSWFNNELERSYGWSCQETTDARANKKIVLKDNSVLANEAYILDIEKEQILIQAASEAGYFYGFQTLMQLFPVELNTEVSIIEVPLVTIRDQPRFGWRGLNLDIARHFFGPATIKKIIDQMAAHKLNRLHFHLTDSQGWRIEMKEYPKLHEIGSIGNYSDPQAPSQYLTEEEAREIAAYANERQIVIIPEIEMPAHSGAIGRAYPEFDGGDNTLNVANEDAIRMVEHVLVKVAELFSTDYVHFGSDELRVDTWEKRPEMRAKIAELGLANQKELEGWFDRRIADFIISRGLRPIAWDESSRFGINKGTIVQWWRALIPETLDLAAREGYDIILSPVDHLYFDYPSDLSEAGGLWEGLHNGANSTELIYHWKVIPETFNDSMKNQILGIEAAVWTEFIPNQRRLEYMIFPRMSALSEKAWTTKSNLDWEHFKNRMTVQYARFKRDGINYRIPDLSLEERKMQQPEAFEGPIPESE